MGVIGICAVAFVAGVAGVVYVPTHAKFVSIFGKLFGEAAESSKAGDKAKKTESTSKSATEAKKGEKMPEKRGARVVRLSHCMRLFHDETRKSFSFAWDLYA